MSSRASGCRGCCGRKTSEALEDDPRDAATPAGGNDSGAREPLGGTARPRDAHARLHAGLRVSELIAVNRADIELGTGAHVRVEGIGRKQRTVPLTNDAQAVLAAWLDERAALPDDPLFPTRTGRRLTRDAVERRVATHAATAGQRCPSLAAKHVHPHALRHSCAMSLLQAHVDSTVIALRLGHAATGSTQQYIHADMTIKECALALLTPPTAAPGRHTPTDEVLAYLDSLG